MDLTSVTPAPNALKALSHPTRLQLLSLLRIEGPATATTLAARVGINTGAASYHLRQLAQHGFITDASGRGDGRDRWWEAKHQSTVAAKTATSPEDRQALDAYLQSVAMMYTQNLQAAMEERATLPDEWRLASTFSDYHLKLTPARARELVERLHQVLREVSEDTGSEVGDFVVQLSAYPRPGVVGVDPA